MENYNKVKYDEMNSKLNEMQMLSERAETSIKNFNNLIENNINSGSKIWDGESAAQFINSWNTMKDEIPEIIEILKKQLNNIKMFIENSKESDEN